MKQIKVYPLAKASAPPPMQFMNGSNQNINTVFPDTLRYFELLAMLVNEEPAELFDPLERWQMQAIGIEKGKPFAPTKRRRRSYRKRRGSAAPSHAPIPMPILRPSTTTRTANGSRCKAD